MEDLNMQVLLEFGVKPRRVVKEKSYYICHTDKGIRVVRKSFDTACHIMFQHRVKEHLAQLDKPNKKIIRTDSYYCSNTGEPYVNFEDNIYVMTDLFPYKESDFGRSDEIEKIIEATAIFHICARDAKLSDGHTHFAEDDLVGKYKRNITELSAIKKKIGIQKRMSDFDVLFLKNYQYYMNDLLTSIEILEKTNLQSYIQKARGLGQVCHNLLKEENVFYHNGHLYILGFSHAAIDYSLYDVCSVIQRHVKDMPKEPLSIHRLMELYHLTNPILAEEVEILYALLKYPYKFIKICNQYYSRKRTWTPSVLNNRIQHLIAGQKEYADFIDALV